MKRTIKVIIGIAILIVLVLGIVFLIAMKNFSSSLDGPTSILLDALEQNDYKKAKQAVKRGANINYALLGRSLLHQSVVDNDITDVIFLIKNKANLNIRSRYGRTPLHEAALYGRYEIAKLLIEAGADVNVRNPRGETPLFYAEVGLIVGPPRTEMTKKVAKLLKLSGATR